MQRTFFRLFAAPAVVAAVAFFLTFAPSAPAQAQLDLSTVVSTVDPVTKLPGDKWIQLATALVDGSSVIGRPEVFVLNATGQELITVVCDRRYALVGPKPAVEGNPTRIRAWKAVVIGTKGYDGYCKDGLVAQSETGTAYKGSLVTSDGTFTNATFVIFYKAQ